MKNSKIFFRTLICICLALSPVTSTQANTTKHDTQQTFRESLIESLQTVDQLSVVLALQEVNTDAIRAIRNDINAKNPNKTVWPTIKLKGNDVLIDGKSTEIHILSYSPLTISYRGEHWSYDKNISTDTNYFSLQKFLNQKNNFSFGSFVLTPAIAGYKATFGILGGLASTVAGIFIALVAIETAPVWAPILLATSVGLGIAGGTYLGSQIDSKLKSLSKKERDTLKTKLAAITDAILKGDFELACSTNQVTIKLPFEADSSIIRIDRTQKENPISIVAKDGKPLATHLTADHLSQLASLTDNCRTDNDAKIIKTKLHESYALTRNLDADKNLPYAKPGTVQQLQP